MKFVCDNYSMISYFHYLFLFFHSVGIDGVPFQINPKFNTSSGGSDVCCFFYSFFIFDITSLYLSKWTILFHRCSPLGRCPMIWSLLRFKWKNPKPSPLAFMSWKQQFNGNRFNRHFDQSYHIYWEKKIHRGIEKAV